MGDHREMQQRLEIVSEPGARHVVPSLPAIGWGFADLVVAQDRDGRLLLTERCHVDEGGVGNERR